MADDTTAPTETRPEPAPVDDLVVTHHTLVTASGERPYTATTGRIVLREEVHEDGEFRGWKPKAELFVVSYTLDDAEPGSRPVTFAFNGGPGSSSVWLHLGLLGPRRVLMGDAGNLLPPPYSITDNAESLLEHSDIVFIDPVSTGFSRIIEGGKPADYHGFQRDLEAVGEVIRLWTSRNGRWLSPKYLAGESYGTMRASALAGHLQQRYGLYLNGLMLISTVIDMGTVRFTEGNDLAHALYLPTYAAIAHYHGVSGSAGPDGSHGSLGSDGPDGSDGSHGSLADTLREAERFATGDYLTALTRGSRLDRDERARVIRRVAGFTGLSEDYVDRADLRLEHQRYFRELLRSRRLVAGRLDGRFTGWESDDAAEHPTHDPSYTAIHGPYSAALNHYVRAELGYRSDLPYEILTDRVQPWSYAEFEGRHVTVASTLAEAMRHNAHLRVYVACGYYDGATPYFAAEHAIAHLALPEELRGNITLDYYESGHMMYVHEPSRLQQSRAIAEFVSGG